MFGKATIGVASLRLSAIIIVCLLIATIITLAVWPADLTSWHIAAAAPQQTPAPIPTIPPPFDPGPSPAPKNNPDDGQCPDGNNNEPKEETCSLSSTIDPVYLHSGEFFLEETDLRISGRGLDYEFHRIYKNQIQYDGALGPWQHSYDQFLFMDGNSLVHVHEARADRYGSTDGIHFTVPAGFYTELISNPNGTYTLRNAQGRFARFHAFDGSPIQGKLASLSDRNGNTITFAYDEFGYLVTVTDTLGRPITYTYAPAPDGQTRLANITDFIGRQVKFTYDSHGDLVAVTSPAVTGTPNGNDFAVGKTWRYTYSSGFADSRLNHNLLTIIAPNEVADGSLIPRVVNTYGTDPNRDAFDRVTQQQWGGTNASGVPAGGLITLTYERLNPNGDPADLNLPRNRTTLMDRNGNAKVYEHNVNGHRLNFREYSNRDVRASDPEFWEMKYEYNADGEHIRIVHPGGTVEVMSYDDANPDRRQQGNQLQAIRLADPIHGGDQTTITRSWTHEPLYTQVRTETDPRGNDPTYQPPNSGVNNPARYTTVYTFDYEEACDFAAIGAHVGQTAAAVQTLLNAAGLCITPLGDVNGDGLINQINGNIIRIEYPTVHLLPDANQALVEGDTSQEIVVLRTYNQFGQLLSETDAEGNLDVNEYYPARDPNGDGLIDNPTADPITGGYLKQASQDTASAASRNSGTNPLPTTIRQAYGYDAVGNLTRYINGRGIATDYIVNQLDQIVQIVYAASHDHVVPDPAEPLPLVDFQYLERRFYDSNNNLVLQQVEDRGNTSNVDGNPLVASLPADVPNPDPVGGPAFVDTIFRYDILDNRIEQIQEVTNGAAPLFLYTYDRYDPNGNPVLTVLPASNATASRYDERDLLFQSTRGAIVPPPQALLAADDASGYAVRGGTPAVTTYHYDHNRNLIESVDAADTDGSVANNSELGGAGDRIRYLYDGLERRTSSVDSLGNQTVYQYDPADNVVRLTRFGPVGGASPISDGADALPMPVSSAGIIQVENLVNPTLLEATETRYDELNRPFQTDRALFASTTATQRRLDLADGASEQGKGDLTPNDSCAVPGVAAPPSGYLGCVSTRTEYDRNGRTTFTVEDDSDSTRTFYDGADRVIQTLDAEGNRIEIAYDDNSNVIETRETDVAQQPGVADEIFLTTAFYDSLDRRQRSVDNLGHTHDYRYDARSNLVAIADAAGPVGPAITRRAFNGGALTIDTTNLFGNVTRYTYDGLSRKVSEEIVLTASGQGDGVNIGATLEGVPTTIPTPDIPQGGGDGLITLRMEWDANSLLASLTDDNGNQTQYTYDNLDRRLAETKGLCIPPALAEHCEPPTTITYLYDPDDNIIQLVDENGSVQTMQYDAGNRRTARHLQPASGVVGTTEQTFEYDGLSRPTRATDNNEPAEASDDSTITGVYDSLSRVVEETQQIGALPAQSISAAWRAANLRTVLSYPNERTLAYTFDRLDRIRLIEQSQVPLLRGLPNLVHLPLILADTTWMQQQSADLAAASVQRVTDESDSILAEYSYVGAGRVLERRYDNDTRLTYLDDTNTLDAGYDGLRRPVQLRHLRGDNSLIVGFTHTYDRLNNKLNEGKLHDLVNSEVYGYDAAYRLTNFDRPDPSAQQPLYRKWSLDGAGNWQQVDAEARQHSSFNELLERNAGTIISLRYDHNGNQIDDGAFTFQWDTFNRLRTITRKADNALVAMYSYDAAGRRIRRVVTNADALNGTTHFYLDGWQEIEERDGAGSLVQQYVYGGGYIDELLMLDRNLDGDATAIGAGDQQLFYHQNMLYSVYALTDDTARIVDGYQYDAYGRQTVYTPGSNGAVEFGGDDVIAAGGVSGVGNPYLFTGRRLDGETKLYYYRMRYFDAIQGRFTQRDRIGVWEDMRNLGNGYTYVANNPLSYTDPSGLAMPCSSTQSGTVVNIKVCGNLIYNKSGAKLTKTYKHSTTVSAEFGAEYKGLSGKLATEHTEEEEESFELCPGQCVKYCYHYKCTCAKEYWEPSSWTWWVTGIGDFYMWNCEKTGEGLEDCTQAERDGVGVK